VIDVDGRYRSVADEHVLGIRELVESLGSHQETTAAAATLEPEDFEFYVGVLGVAFVQAGSNRAVLSLGAGMQALGDLREVLREAGDLLLAPAADPRTLQRRAAASYLRRRRGWYEGTHSTLELGAGQICNRGFFALSTPEQTRILRELASDWRLAAEALDICALTLNAEVRQDNSLVVGPWRQVDTTREDADGRLLVDGTIAYALDLRAFDAREPWMLDAHTRVDPGVRLSAHPALAAIVAAEAEARTADETSLTPGLASVDEPPRARFDKTLRAEARRVEEAGGDLPDLLGVSSGADRDSWALELVPPGHPNPLARYLDAARTARPQLQRDFPGVPGLDTEPLARWALRSGVGRSGLDTQLLTRAAEVTLEAVTRPAEEAPSRGPLPSGVNLVGYLAGEIGLGESARLMDEALQAQGIATSTHDVSHRIRSRRGAEFRKSTPKTFDTTLICVNGADTDRFAPQMRDLLERTRVIGMWYWELEDFPALHQVGFQHVDEVWAATDFMRDAIAKHAGDIPVRTVTPPFPQAGDDPGVLPERFGIPHDRPWFLFTFDFLSQAARKNPYGLVDSFTRAFGDRPPDQRPVLVIKTINAVHYPADAERLRFQVMGRDDVRFIDEYLANDQRHVLVSNCTAFVSLHKAEGLGLTVAEAMAWGKPVITTAYGGVMQFCNEDNAFLVDWVRGYVEETVGPYEKGRPWAEPDLEQAAAYMRTVVDDPERARALGTRAARDIRELHNAEAAGAHMRDVLGRGAREWRGKRPPQHPVSPSQEVRTPLAVRVRERVGTYWNRWRSRSG